MQFKTLPIDYVKNLLILRVQLHAPAACNKSHIVKFPIKIFFFSKFRHTYFRLIGLHLIDSSCQFHSLTIRRR